MRIPFSDSAIIASSKLVDYLLDPTHPDGAAKARALARAGFHRAAPDVLERALREQHLALDATAGQRTPYGDKYETTGLLKGPAGVVIVTSVWIVRHGERSPRLVTVIPREKKRGA